MKNNKRILRIVAALFFLVGISVMAYPFVANKWNKIQENKMITIYDRHLEESEKNGAVDYEKEKYRAIKYNDSLRYNIEKTKSSENNMDYSQCLNLNNDGMMGYISIPKIDVKLPIYHTTDIDVLQKFVGHQEGSSLINGGESTHSVLAAHRGMPSSRLFTDLDRMEEGDKFYIFVLDEVHTYQVDKIYPMIDKNDTEALNEALQVKDGEDYITLLTCTPYGVNTHRLLVRGSRIKDNIKSEKIIKDAKDQSVEVDAYTVIFLLIVLILFIAMARIITKRNKVERKGDKC